ncbi:beta-glucoside operon transcriptional antiterminator [Clostridium saccharoperbutylacetonicum]|uniref:Beta-glucoside operon antiterminator n=1 Tax=Clostridium saccharoperbutylacetonicum N1-4(HMT) TaxID=931276 RepID=M1ML92_9CLOT|nr:PRD domain-containing protein [Clostridium saccharoperbutylacetonicum]AGF58684.1 beta-glucoside operon antiterminator [Clostridium saccharoperbutylacetonicum N1-4(HMT)]NRT60537.1 beta-glucoside operon transcriptional antiterminator [Clostridium saccharoperbutylacetonicum]NSB23851.1 beta-glucoside operon transcriptional antiterminator [Clostridium saccharoperbutylacetonicum]NSB43227.1 beta-glucoside operon transcriptional antiterminator [Clostridium saccharoperbutylacetonicum]
MKVIKKLNNNVVLALNKDNEEIIVVGKGLGFQKIPYEITDETVIEKIYVIPKNTRASEILDSMPTEIIAVTEKVISCGIKVLKKELNSIIFLTLCDHINFAIQRSKEGMEIKSPLYWEIKHLYSNEYKVGLEAVNIINDELKMKMSTEEAPFIALHFINAQMDTKDIAETTKVTSITGELLNIVKYYFKIEFNEESFNFTRFVTHIRYFILRQINKENLEDDNEFMYEIMKKKYNEEYKCVKKIEEYLYKNYNWYCSADEKLYLMMHIQRVKSREVNNK